MAHKKKTSSRVSKVASKQLRSPRTSKAAKTTAGSALAQSPGKHRSTKKR